MPYFLSSVPGRLRDGCRSGWQIPVHIRNRFDISRSLTGKLVARRSETSMKRTVGFGRSGQGSARRRKVITITRKRKRIKSKAGASATFIVGRKARDSRKV